MVRLTVPRSMRPATVAMSAIFPSRPPVKRARRRAIAGTYPFDVEQVRAEYTELMGGHVRGKIVITIP